MSPPVSCNSQAPSRGVFRPQVKKTLQDDLARPINFFSAPLGPYGVLLHIFKMRSGSRIDLRRFHQRRQVDASTRQGKPSGRCAISSTEKSGTC
eukprot:756697-Hanusia_phi.AAC.5